FGQNDPMHFENLQISMLSLFRVVTLEDWTDVMYINMWGCGEYGYDESSIKMCTNSQASPVTGALFFVSFVLIGTMVILNLFIGVIMSGMDEAQAEAEQIDRDMRHDDATAVDDIKAIEEQLDAMQKALRSLQHRL